MGLLALAAGCVKDLEGSNVQFDFSKATITSPAGVHTTLYAFQSDPMAGRLFELQRFEIHKIVEINSPCFIDVGDHVPHPGLHVSKYFDVISADNNIPDYTNPPANATEAQKIAVGTAKQRQLNVDKLASDDMAIKAVVSASTASYPAVAASCADANGIPPPECTDEVSNQRRLEACQKFWAANPDYYEGTDRVLTAPLNGIAHGNVDGTNPINNAPVGGAQLFIDEVLDSFTGFALYQQMDGAAASDPGQIMLFGTPEIRTRGVIHVHMTNPATPTSTALTADLAIFSDLGEDDVSF